MDHNQLPDTPWHVGFAKKKEEDPRRHKARCVHISESGECRCVKAGAYTFKCGGSAHCRFYAETWKQWEQVKKDTQTVEEEETERVNKFKDSLKKKRDQLRNNQENAIHYKQKDKIIRCAICNEKLIKKNVAQYCKYCGTYYVHEAQVKECKANNHALDEEMIIVGKVHKKELNVQGNVGRACVHAGKKNKCTLETSKRYGKPCRKESCEEYKGIKVFLLNNH